MAPTTPSADYVAGLLWVQQPGSRDVYTKTTHGDYTISVDSLFAGGSHYLWVAGQAEGDEPFASYPNMHHAKAAAQAHSDALAARPAAPTTEPSTLIGAEHSRMMRAARPDQPAANTRVVRKLAAALWFESEGEAVEPLYDVSRHAQFVPEYEAKARAILSAIIGTATPAQSDKIAEAARPGKCVHDPSQPEVGSIWRHVKSGHDYRVIACGMIESNLTPSVIYTNMNPDADPLSEANWTRPMTEFCDGRFIRAIIGTALTAPPDARAVSVGVLEIIAFGVDNILGAEMCDNELRTALAAQIRAIIGGQDQCK